MRPQKLLVRLSLVLAYLSYVIAYLYYWQALQPQGVSVGFTRFYLCVSDGAQQLTVLCARHDSSPRCRGRLTYLTISAILSQR
jgi:hypothetical protein